MEVGAGNIVVRSDISSADSLSFVFHGEVSVHWHDTEFPSGCAKIACIQLSSVVDLAMTMWHPHGIRVASWWHPGVFVGIHVFGPKKTLDFMWGK